MKRSRNDLTGGSGDINPQWLTFNAITQSAANTYTESSINLPINRFQNPKGRSIVMEALKVEFTLPTIDSNSAAGGDLKTCSIQLTPSSSSAINTSDPKVLAQYSRQFRGAFTAGGTYSVVENNPECIDLTDGNGHGVLVATDTLFLGVNTVGYGTAASFACRILYRFKIVTLEEYIGIVQSQQ